MEKRPRSLEVKPFSFQSFETEAGAASHRSFEFPELGASAAVGKVPSAKVIRAEREAEAKSSFKIDAIVRDMRGLSSQEQDDLDQRISEEVERRIARLRDEAHREGLEKGRMEGADAALREAMQRHEAQIEQMEGMLLDLQRQSEERLEAQRRDVYELVKRLSKWLVLKEVGDDSYLPKLVEKLILEMNQKQNLILRVHPDDLALMPGLLEKIEARLGALTNVRVEPGLEMSARGLVLETENGIIDATPEALFQTIDKLFEAVVGHA